jgi:hypothetical protein
MDEQMVRRHAEAHADAVVRGDMDALVQDFSAALQPQLPTLAQALPQPVNSAAVLSVDAASTPAVVHIKYSGVDKEVTIRSEWSGDERPVISAAAPV